MKKKASYWRAGLSFLILWAVAVGRLAAAVPRDDQPDKNENAEATLERRKPGGTPQSGCRPSGEKQPQKPTHARLSTSTTAAEI